jgi:tRNA and rRNA cytosine-C5-methylases
MKLPVKFCEEMKRVLGDEYEAYLASMNEKRKCGLRVNTAKISVSEFERIAPFPLTRIPFVENGFYYDGDAVQPAKHPYYFAGLYYLQDPSAMTPASRLPVEEGDVVLDLCAAPGGKATELAARLHGTGLLIANDISSKRAKALLKNIELFGVENSFIVTEYPQKLGEHFPGFFDKILIDAPCSGEGMFRKEPSMIKAWEQNGPAFYASLQEDILSQALPMLKPGGYLLYSTCTFSPLEDEGTVEKILSMDPELELEPIRGYEGFAEGNPAFTGSRDPSIRRCVRIFPHRLDGEGHFLALFHKKEHGDCPDHGCRQSRKGLTGEDKRLFDGFAADIDRVFEPERLESKKGMVYYMPEALPQMSGLRFLRSGLFLGEVKKNRFEPSQSLAMALKPGQYQNCLDLSVRDERVIRYLKGETLVLTGQETAKPDGWQLVCVDGFPLGWGKKNKSALKNKYHSGWRML